MNSYEKLLIEWCDGLLPLQIKGYGELQDGGFLCKACTAIHGRADNAIFPLLYAYKKTGEEKYLTAARSAFRFQKRLICADGGAYNDGNNGWKGITVFSLLCQLKSVIYFGDVMGEDFKAEVINRCRIFAEFCHKTFTERFHSNINYYAAAADALILCGRYFENEEYTAHGKALLDYCMRRFTENGLLVGEAFPHDSKSETGCLPIDMGYNVEESIPCIVEAAKLSGDEKALNLLAEYMEKTLDFMFPDGGWNNTFGTRNNKWTYYGSRTSDGCLAALMTLGKIKPVFYEAAIRNAELQKNKTCDGLLYGGYSYKKAGQRPCVHHTFCHAVGLAEALLLGLSDDLPRTSLPTETEAEKIKYFKEIDTYLISVGDIRATVTGFDYKSYSFANGAAHASGGTVTSLYSLKNGAVIMGSTYDYHASEPMNMQWPIGSIAHRPLLPRIDVIKDGKKYSSALFGKPQMKAEETKDGVLISAVGGFKTVGGAELPCAVINIKYLFSNNSVKISATVEGEGDFSLILPIIEDSARIVTDNAVSKEKIFWLSGGFTADEYTLKPDGNGFEVEILM